MPIKTEVKMPEKPALKFPSLMRSLTTGCVVLFTNPSTGTVVHQQKGGQPIGHHADDWIDATDPTAWEPVESLTIKMVD